MSKKSITFSVTGRVRDEYAIAGSADDRRHQTGHD